LLVLLLTARARLGRLIRACTQPSLDGQRFSPFPGERLGLVLLVFFDPYPEEFTPLLVRPLGSLDAGGLLTLGKILLFCSKGLC
jgi:hypothetical protein